MYFYFSDMADTKNISEAVVHCESFKPASKVLYIPNDTFRLVFYLIVFCVITKYSERFTRLTDFKSIPRNTCILRDK